MTFVRWHSRGCPVRAPPKTRPDTANLGSRQWPVRSRGLSFGLSLREILANHYIPTRPRHLLAHAVPSPADQTRIVRQPLQNGHLRINDYHARLPKISPAGRRGALRNCSRSWASSPITERCSSFLLPKAARAAPRQTPRWPTSSLVPRSARTIETTWGGKAPSRLRNTASGSARQRLFRRRRSLVFPRGPTPRTTRWRVQPRASSRYAASHTRSSAPHLGYIGRIAPARRLDRGIENAAIRGSLLCCDSAVHSPRHGPYADHKSASRIQSASKGSHWTTASACQAPTKR
jgi:hypothetical protein